MSTVDELPAHVGGRGQPVDLDHVVLPLDPAGIVPVVVVAVIHALHRRLLRVLVRHFFVVRVLLVPVLLVPVAFV